MEGHTKKKINIILPGLGDSGGIQVVKKYKELMEKDGWDVIIYAPLKAYNLHRYRSNIKNKIHQIYCTIKTIPEIKSKTEYKWIWKVTNKSIRNADITMATLWATAFDVNKLSDTKGEKWHFIQGYEIWDNEAWGKKAYLLPLKKIVISTWINERIKRDIGIGPFPVVCNGIDTDVFHKVYCEKDGTKINFLMLNHVLPKKGVANGLKAFEKVAARHSNCVLRMFGMCDSSNLPDYIEYHQNPTKKELVELYSKSDIFIFSSLEEGWGLAPLEAMACGCAVVGTRTGFVLDLGVHGENMMISEPGDIEKMVENIECLINNETVSQKIKLAGNKTAVLKWDDSANWLMKLLEESMEREKNL